MTDLRYLTATLAVPIGIALILACAFLPGSVALKTLGAVGWGLAMLFAIFWGSDRG